ARGDPSRAVERETSTRDEKRIDLSAQRPQDFNCKTRLGRQFEARRRLMRHPFRNAGNRTIGLRDDDQINASISIAPLNEHGLATARMERIRDPRLDRLLVGSLSLFRATLESPECLHRPRADGLRMNGATNEERASCAARRFLRLA